MRPLHSSVVGQNGHDQDTQKEAAGLSMVESLFCYLFVLSFSMTLRIFAAQDLALSGVSHSLALTRST